ncbi:MAG: Na+/H+ antiporter [Eggerthellaceae bacterium]|nr:Na+/H+ antiporter [Eggerthellaceae bacterium]
MAALELALVLLITVLASAVLDQMIPRVSLPLIQIFLGFVMAFFAGERINITLNPELFLVLFVAPLLFHEAREADKIALWRNRSTMLSFAIGLVVAIVLVVGFATHLMIPSISLAAAFALGAALGPTDPLAVASVSQQADIPARQQTTLQGESLLKDASGIVSFHFASAAVVTGTFSLAEALIEFITSFFGALVVGIAFGYLLVRLADKVRDWGLENTTFHVALELCTPFIAYLLGEAISVSGIILVVACGITMSMLPRDLGPSMSHMNIVSTSVWQVITFALNGVVFVMLGTQLPVSLTDIWESEGISNITLVLYVLAITVLMHGVRFVWTLASDTIVMRRKKTKMPFKRRLRLAAITTFAGAKGTITLAIMFSIPNWINAGASMERFPNRDLLIFLACGVILVSLLLATFVVPLLAPRKKEDVSEARKRDKETRIDILRTVIEELAAHQTKETRIATSQVIDRYNDRIERITSDDELDEADGVDDELRIMVLRWEEEYVLESIAADEMPPLEAYQYLSRLARVESLLQHGKQKLLSIGVRLRRFVIMLKKLWARFRKKLPGEAQETSSQIMREIQLKTSQYVVKKLQDEMSEIDAPTEKISALIVEYQKTINLLRGKGPSITAIANAAEPDLEVTRFGLRTELELIQEAYEEGRLTRAGANKMRENVYLMQVDLEDYV